MVVIIFPSTLIFERAPSGSLINLAYISETAHIITHIIVYAILTLLLIPTFKLNLNWTTLGITLIFALFIGVLQEGLQFIVSADRVFGLPEIFDLGVNLLGALLGLALIYLRRSTHKV
ncbi:MAG: hypothetical protein DWQ07_22475 [Chloroflexi bacterium]|nr:MAG: hypothetical protein DWQ07_22475 [Chloroflexota bacterium]MBL1193915.1 hypothetical protein [Chloroflexota bacterium]